jgi:hypothetical protein
VLAWRSDGTRSALITVALSFTLGAATVVAFLGDQKPGSQVGLRVATSHTGPAWTEIRWPFPVDLWSSGKAFKCRSADCGGEITLYLRAKIGFCNCLTGVADDAELDRLADINLLGGTHSADGPGRPITVAWMMGRSRFHKIDGTSQSGKAAVVIAFNDRCDAIVGTAIVSHDRSAAAEQAVIDFLNGDVVLNWAQVTLGL